MRLNREQVVAMLPILACGAGIYVGLHFNILALLPLSCLGAGAYVTASLAAGQDLLDSAGLLLFPLLTVQAGYFLGLTIRPAYSNLRARLNIEHSERV
jgi:nitric oxide reductase large subunit